MQFTPPPTSPQLNSSLTSPFPCMTFSIPLLPISICSAHAAPSTSTPASTVRTYPHISPDDAVRMPRMSVPRTQIPIHLSRGRQFPPLSRVARQRPATICPVRALQHRPYCPKMVAHPECTSPDCTRIEVVCLRVEACAWKNLSRASLNLVFVALCSCRATWIWVRCACKAWLAGVGFCGRYRML